jgi:hypothetical protein
VLAVVPAAAARQLEAQMRATGSVAISWHGDPARGCAASGLCAYRGSLTVRPGSDGLFDVEATHGRVTDSFGYFGFGNTAVVRVARAAGDGSEDGGCVDITSTDQLSPYATPAARGQLRVALSGYGLSPGRCAGPAFEQVIDRLRARHAVSLARLRAGGTTIDLSRRVPFASGSFSGAVVSTLRLRIGRLAPVSEGSFPSPPPPRRHRARRIRVVDVQARYRVTSLIGYYSAAFHGLPGPDCLPFDACATKGTETWAIITRDGLVEVDASARARRSDRGLRGAVTALERPGATVETYGDLAHAVGETTADLERPGPTRCRDHARARAPSLSGAFGTRIALALGGSGAEGFGDLLRTGCPGPTEADVLGRGTLGASSLPVRALLRRRLDVTLRSRGRFGGIAYSGSRRGHFVLQLRRIAARVVYHKVRVQP